MNKIVFKLAFRSILKNKTSSIINIIGFSLGMAACLFIFLFIKFETSFDGFHPKNEKLYRVIGSFEKGVDITKSGSVWFPIAKDIKKEIAGIDDFCRITQDYPTKCFVENEIREIEKLRYADSNFFKFFKFGLLTGNAENVLSNPDNIVLSEKMAVQLFGNENPVGESLVFNSQQFTVSGIAANAPSNTHLDFDAIVSTKYIEQSKLFWKGYGGGITLLSYLQLAENVTPQQVEKAFPGFFNTKINKEWKGTGSSFSASLQNIKDVHLSDGTIDYDSSSNKSKKSIYIIVCINALILLLAIINYILLYTAQKITKNKNIQILGIFGAGKLNLMAQTYVEVLFLTSIASLIGVFMLLSGLSFLNTYFETSITLENNTLQIVIFLAVAIFMVSIFVTYFSTRQKVFVNPIVKLKNSLPNNSGKKMKGNLLVTFQFTVVIVLLISFFIISRQNSFLLNSELGFDKENIITIKTDDELLNTEMVSFKEDLQRLAEINSVSLSSQMIGKGVTLNGYYIGDEEETSMLNALYTDADFLDCFKVNLLSGRNFKTNADLDKNAVLINERLAKRGGWENPLMKEIKRNGSLKIIGVVEDFNFASLESAVEPMVIMTNPDWDGWSYSIVNIRINTTNIQGLLDQIKKLWIHRFPETPFDVSFLDDALASNYKSITSQQKIISFFSFIGILIAVIGLLGLTVFTARTRVKEIGIRKVNGATVMDILIMLNRDFVKLVGLAFLISVPISWYLLSKWLENFAYKITMSWWVFVLSGAIALAIAMVTVSWQSFRAATANPIDGLREE